MPVVKGDSSGEPLLGLERSLAKDSTLQGLLRQNRIDWIRSPNQETIGTVGAARSAHHGDFDDDEATVRATLARILGRAKVTQTIRFGRTGAGKRAQREQLMQSTRG